MSNNIIPPPTPGSVWIEGATSSQPRTMQQCNRLYRRHTMGIELPSGEVIRSDWWVPAGEWNSRRY